MSKQHTPGPWHFHGDGMKRERADGTPALSYCIYAGDVQTGKDLVNIAEVCVPMGEKWGHETTQANARLIESAPELFGTAEDLADLLDLLDAHNSPEIIESKIRKYGARAKALIAKIRNPAPVIHHPDDDPKMYPYCKTDDEVFERWIPIAAGHRQPTEDESKLMATVKTALDSGVFYQDDLYEYVKKNADYIPTQAYTLTGSTEHGPMGYEIYHVRSALRDIAERAENLEALKLYAIGQKIGTLYIQGKRVTGLVIEKFEGTTVWMTTTIHGNTVKVWVTARAIAECKQRAIQRGWCKS